jgi:superfamily II DNA or RNA helicase
VASALEALQAAPTKEGAPAVLLVQATGTGKTVCAIYCLLWFLSRWPGKRVLWMVGRRVLVKQAAAEVNKAARLVIESGGAGAGGELAALPGQFPSGVRVGVEMASDRALMSGLASDQVIVASFQSLRRRLSGYDSDDFSLIIVDEAHNGIADAGYHKVYEHFKTVPRLGLTATPFNSKGDGMGGFWRKVAYTHSLTAAIADGDLVPLRARSVPLDGVHIEGVDFDKSELSDKDIAIIEEAFMKEENLHKMASVIIKEVEFPAIVFCASTKHSAALADVLNRYEDGEIARHIDCYQDDALKAKTLEDFKTGGLSVVCNYGLWFEGLDAPRTRSVVFATNTNKVRWAQGIGRVTRHCCAGSYWQGLRELGIPVPAEREETVCTCGENKRCGWVWDFFANSAEHDVSGIWNALAPGASAEDVEAMQRRLEAEPDADPVQVVAAVEEAAAAARAKAARVAAAKVQDVNLLDPLDPVRSRIALAGLKLPRPDGALASPNQIEQVRALVFFRNETKLAKAPWVNALTEHQAEYLIEAARRRKKQGLASLGQLITLSRATDVTGPNGERGRRYSPEVLQALKEPVAAALVRELQKGWTK